MIGDLDQFKKQVIDYQHFINFYLIKYQLSPP